jgi:magnesium chelatase subunit I
VSQRLPISCLENVISNAERRSILTGDNEAIPRIADIYSALPAITGKIELEYEGELKGADSIARDLIRQAVQMVFRQYYPTTDFKQVIEWFEMGGQLKLSDNESAATTLGRLERVQGLLDKTEPLGTKSDSPAGLRASAAEMVLEGLYSLEKITRSDERGFAAAERRAAGAQELYRDYSVERNRYKKPLN